MPAPPADVRLSYGDNPNQFGDLRLPRTADPFPVVINIHGGFWRAKYDLDHAGHLCAALTKRNIATWNIEYRRVGGGGGWPATFDDVRRAFHYLELIGKDYNLDQSRLLVMGHSAGGQLAMCLAADQPGIKRVLSLAGVVDLQQAWQLHLSNDAVVEFLRGKPDEVPQRYADADPSRLPIRHSTQWLIHGTADDVVPPTFSRDYAAQKKSVGEEVRYTELSAADHFDLIDPRSTSWPHVESAVSRLLGL